MRISILDIQRMKASGQPIAAITAYDAPTARLIEGADAPLILVGDSLGMVFQGQDTTIGVTLDDMIYHGRIVAHATQRPLIVVDLPFMSYKISVEQALTAAARVMRETGAGAVKLEGGTEVAPTVQRIVESGIPVMAHIGLIPQSFHQLGGWRIQGRKIDAAKQLLNAALTLEAVGAFAIVLESIPITVAKIITQKLSIPTIGIGAGIHCNGQIQVLHDVLGLSPRQPKHAKSFADLKSAIHGAVAAYVEEVASRAFPTAEHATDVDEQTQAELNEV
ncbi:MAG: 3-methyl-2-oxobutanoate hydroxymethyltransferase [Anaerolineae bacterium]|nr:3-methyl-2-oxobutanoate hydroxymethyltransferase [Anaerolineae bacterium]